MKVDLNNSRNHRKYSNTWRLNNTLLNDWCVTEKIREEFKKLLELNENENTTYQDLWDALKAVVRGKLIAIAANIKKSRDLSNIQPNDAP
jgi:hypothetical protein